MELQGQVMSFLCTRGGGTEYDEALWWHRDDGNTFKTGLSDSLSHMKL